MSLLIFKERERERVRERETSLWGLNMEANRSSSPQLGKRCNWESDQQPFGVRGNAQPTDSRWPRVQHNL